MFLLLLLANNLKEYLFFNEVVNFIMLDCKSNDFYVY